MVASGMCGPTLASGQNYTGNNTREITWYWLVVSEISISIIKSSEVLIVQMCSQRLYHTEPGISLTFMYRNICTDCNVFRCSKSKE